MDGSLRSFASYEQYAADQVPVLWMPSQYLSVAEVSSKLTGATPLSPLGNINPENWRLAS
jgi:peptide/nickel transport system substrate-binding protein